MKHLVALALVATFGISLAHLQTLRWLSRGDLQTMDPDSRTSR